MTAEDGLTAEARQVLEELKAAIVQCDAEAAAAAAGRAVERGVDPLVAIKHAITRSAEIVHEKFDSGEYYLPHLVLAADAMTAASEVLERALPQERARKKVVVIGTVEADLHSVGKNIVAMMLRSGGFEVHDLGVDVKSAQFIAKAKDVGADIIAASSLLTTTMPYQRELIEDLKAARLRDRFKVMVGGGPVGADWAQRIGADGYGRDAGQALEVARRLVGIAAEASS